MMIVNDNKLRLQGQILNCSLLHCPHQCCISQMYIMMH